MLNGLGLGGIHLGRAGHIVCAGLPCPFHCRKEGERIFIFKEGYESIVRSAECGVRNSGLSNRQSAIPNPRTVKGRGQYPCVVLENGKTVIMRRVRHGGLWGKIAGGVLWGVGRPVRELINAKECLERGVPTAEIVGIRLERVLGGFGTFLGVALPLFRAEVFSKEIPATIDLLGLLTSPQEFHQHKRAIIRAVAMAVRAMHEVGLYHNDLHLKNILITMPSLGRPFKAFVIDLDKSSLHERLLLSQKIKNLLRLDRSIEKFMAVGAYCNTPLLLRDKLRFLRDYMGSDPSAAAWKELARRLNPRYTFHRLWWKITKIANYRLQI
ncbi:MAG TPA: lipopolysaccharide kinase InaA family protein [Candidatus Hypogeohydataceae bacterium YC41]